MDTQATPNPSDKPIAFFAMDHNTSGVSIETWRLIRRQANLVITILKAQAELEEIRKRLAEPDTPKPSLLEAWANEFFTPERQNVLLQRHYLFDECQHSIDMRLSPQRFSDELEKWCKNHGYILNPIELRNPKQNRIIGLDYRLSQKGATAWRPMDTKETLEFFYIQTKPLCSTSELPTYKPDR